MGAGTPATPLNGAVPDHMLLVGSTRAPELSLFGGPGEGQRLARLHYGQRRAERSRHWRVRVLPGGFPVAAVLQRDRAELGEPRFYGTAFAIAPGLFLTAAHVIQNAEAAGVPALLGPQGAGEPLGVARIEGVERWPNDVALLHCNVQDKVTLFDRWRHTRCQVLDDLSAFGFPHAITREDGEKQLNVVFRAYKGHVITIRGFERLPSKPAVYEVCSPFPKASPVVQFCGDVHLTPPRQRRRTGYFWWASCSENRLCSTAASETGWGSPCRWTSLSSATASTSESGSASSSR